MSKAKALVGLIFEITEKSPKHFRFTIVSKMQNLSIEILSDIYRANDTYIDMKIISDMNKSIAHAQQAEKNVDDERMFFKNKLFELKLARAMKIEERVSKRLDYSYTAMTNIKLLDYFTELSAERGCITKKQQERLAKQIYDVRNLLGAFIKSDRKRYKY